MRLLRQLTEGQARLKEGLRGDQGYEGRAGADGTKGSTLNLNYNGLSGEGGLDDKSRALLEANAAAAAALASFSDAQRKEVWALVGKISDRLAELEGAMESGGGGKRSLLTEESSVIGRRIGTLEQEVQLIKARGEGSASARAGVGGSVEDIARASQSANQALGSSNRQDNLPPLPPPLFSPPLPSRFSPHCLPFFFFP